MHDRTPINQISARSRITITLRHTLNQSRGGEGVSLDVEGSSRGGFFFPQLRSLDLEPSEFQFLKPYYIPLEVSPLGWRGFFFSIE